ncbi:hypothetical protein NP284_35965 [Rhodopseudomonas pseudopalustris]|uniref:nucleotide-binding protein n=1 Tax=Rhodopseudomonas pseudopalustris TaxID=1513892 RepID=UPI003F9612EF
MAEHHFSFLATPKPRSSQADETSEALRIEADVYPAERKRLLASVAVLGKGGSGRSTICTNLAAIAQRDGYQVKIIDAGLQKSALAWQMVRGRNDISIQCCQVREIRSAIKAASQDGTEILLIDMPPDPVHARKVAQLVNLVLIAGRPLFFDVDVISRLIPQLIPSKARIGVVINDAPGKRGNADARAVREMRQVLAHVSGALWSGQITHRLAVPFAGMRGLAAFEVKPTSPAASEYNHLWQVIAQTLL